MTLYPVRMHHICKLSSALPRGYLTAAPPAVSGGQQRLQSLGSCKRAVHPLEGTNTALAPDLTVDPLLLKDGDQAVVSRFLKPAHHRRPGSRMTARHSWRHELPAEGDRATNAQMPLSQGCTACAGRK